MIMSTVLNFDFSMMRLFPMKWIPTEVDFT